MNLIDSAIAADDVDQVPARPVDWRWCLKYALMNFAGCLLLFAMLFLFAYYMLDTPFFEQ